MAWLCSHIWHVWSLCPFNFFNWETRTPDWTHVIRNSPGTQPIISVWCLPCNTGNLNQNYEVHITKLHTNYRHQMHTTLPLVVGVIFAPPNCLVLILCLFALQTYTAFGNSRSWTFPMCAFIKLSCVHLGLKPGISPSHYLFYPPYEMKWFSKMKSFLRSFIHASVSWVLHSLKMLVPACHNGVSLFVY